MQSKMASSARTCWWHVDDDGRLGVGVNPEKNRIRNIWRLRWMRERDRESKSTLERLRMKIFSWWKWRHWRVVDSIYLLELIIEGSGWVSPHSCVKTLWLFWSKLHHMDLIRWVRPPSWHAARWAVEAAVTAHADSPVMSYPLSLLCFHFLNWIKSLRPKCAS